MERFAEIVAPDADSEFRRGFADGMREQLGADAIETRVWLDEDGLIRREEVDLGMLVEGRRIDARMRLNFNDFGDGHEVALPADGDVKDVTGEWEDYKAHFSG